MNQAVVDANVWLAVIERGSSRRSHSVACLERLRESGWKVVVPGVAWVELACVLSRKLQNPARARRITEAMLAAAGAMETTIDRAALERALVLGTERYLRNGPFDRLASGRPLPKRPPSQGPSPAGAGRPS